MRSLRALHFALWRGLQKQLERIIWRQLSRLFKITLVSEPLSPFLSTPLSCAGYSSAPSQSPFNFSLSYLKFGGKVNEVQGARLCRKILVHQMQPLLLSIRWKKDSKEVRILPFLSTSAQLCLNASATGVIVFWSELLAEMIPVSSAAPYKFAHLQVGQKLAIPDLASSLCRLTWC